MDTRLSDENTMADTSYNTHKDPSVPVLFSSPEQCCGCGACAAACPVQAISLHEDGCGYIYPQIDEALCIRCGRCKQVCGYQHTLVSESTGNAYAAATSSTQIKHSASGGIFGAMARAMLEQGGVVVGCRYDNCNGLLYAAHHVADDKADLPALLGSKYVQSDMVSVYPKVKQYIKDGHNVLFSGTPCQIAGLHGYLGEKLWASPHLVTIDLVCHGVPNQKMLQNYLAEIKQKHANNAEVVDARFRPKRDGWSNSLQLELVFSDGSEKFIPSDQSSYYDAFLALKTLRENCYHCPFAGRKRPADLTIGDFWGIEEQCPELLEGNGGPFSLFAGVSCVLVNSDRGSEWLEKLGSQLKMEQVPFEAVAAQNAQLKAPAALPKDRADWLRAFEHGGWDEVEHLWLRAKRKQNLRRRVGKLFPVSVKHVIKAVGKQLRL